jgi:hypothetical protein
MRRAANGRVVSIDRSHDPGLDLTSFASGIDQRDIAELEPLHVDLHRHQASGDRRTSVDRVSTS